jgi:hypothetical protein
MFTNERADVRGPSQETGRIVECRRIVECL